GGRGGGDRPGPRGCAQGGGHQARFRPHHRHPPNRGRGVRHHAHAALRAREAGGGVGRYHGGTEITEKKQYYIAKDAKDAQRAQGGVFLLCVLCASTATSAFNLASLL